MSGLMSIGEFSALSGLSPKRLRDYAVGGVLVPAAVDPDTGYRYYAADQLRDAELVGALRQAGMPLSDIKEALRDRMGKRLDAWARVVRADAEERQEALTRARKLLTSTDTGSRTADASEGANMAVQLKVAGRTETGPVREINEDAIVATEQLMTVADGMGGHEAGELASALASAAAVAVFTGRSPDELEAALRAANWAIWERAASNTDLQGMGTTMCAAGVLDDATLVIANVGDSRAYLLRDGALQALTTDHTVAAELVQQGQMTAEEAAVHPHRRLLTRALGVGADVVVDMTRLPLQRGDRMLLCTDGVFTSVPDHDIAALLGAAKAPQAAVDTVVDRAIASGSDDNASAVAAFVA